MSPNASQDASNPDSPGVTAFQRLSGRPHATVASRIWVLLILLLLGVPADAAAKHMMPPPVPAITNAGIWYVVPNDRGLKGYVEAREVATGRKLWSETLFRHWFCPPFQTECMAYEFVTSMTLVQDELILTTERGDTYSLNIRTRAIIRRRPKADAGPGSGTANQPGSARTTPGLKRF